jgi:hypothetical protein
MNVRKQFIQSCGVALSLALVAGCGTNGGSQLPSISQSPLSKNVLQLAVGTANIGQDGTIGLNVVATLRQPNGITGVAADIPTLTMPAGMLVPAGTPGAYTGLVSTVGPNVDAGTNHISGSPQVPLNNANLVNSTLGTFTGVYTYGFGPLNSDQSTSSIGAYYIGVPNSSGGNGFTSSNYFFSNSVLAAIGVPDPTQPLPFFSADPMDYVVGSPAVPFFNNGTFPAGFAGYPAGFTVFELPPAAGTYSLTAHVATSNVSPVDYTASANLASTTPLGPTTVTFTSDANQDGGGTGTVSVPAGVTETEVFLIDINPNSGAATYYTVGPLSGTGAVNYTFPANLGACTTNCPQPSMIAGDIVIVAAVGYDYPAFEAGPPGNTSQKPAIAGANGQADITMSPIVTQPY